MNKLKYYYENNNLTHLRKFIIYIKEIELISVDTIFADSSYFLFGDDNFVEC